MSVELHPRTTAGSEVRQLPSGGWHLGIPAGPRGRYRLAQLDDYAHLARRHLPWHPPFSLRLRARASHPHLPGTWGFGLWNDPFSLSLGLGGASRRLPALPNTAWFFFAAPPNYLSLRDDLPAQGAMAGTFRSPRYTFPWLLAGLPTIPFLALPATARPLRQLARRVIKQDTRLIPTGEAHNPVRLTDWQTYTLNWEDRRVTFGINGIPLLDTPITPHGPLGLVLWVDNQFAALPPNGRLAFGTLANPNTAWIEIEELQISTP